MPRCATIGKMLFASLDICLRRRKWVVKLTTVGGTGELTRALGEYWFDQGRLCACAEAAVDQYNSLCDHADQSVQKKRAQQGAEFYVYLSSPEKGRSRTKRTIPTGCEPYRGVKTQGTP
jgi:hypothetical protein